VNTVEHKNDDMSDDMPWCVDVIGNLDVVAMQILL